MVLFLVSTAGWFGTYHRLVQIGKKFLKIQILKAMSSFPPLIWLPLIVSRVFFKVIHLAYNCYLNNLLLELFFCHAVQNFSTNVQAKTLCSQRSALS